MTLLVHLFVTSIFDCSTFSLRDCGYKKLRIGLNVPGVVIHELWWPALLLVCGEW